MSGAIAQEIEVLQAIQQLPVATDDLIVQLDESLFGPGMELTENLDVEIGSPVARRLEEARMIVANAINDAAEIIQTETNAHIARCESALGR